MQHRYLLLFAALTALAGCSAEQPAQQNSTGAQTSQPGQGPLMRWYTREQIVAGEKVFLEHCAACHGERAQGAANWRNVGRDGKFPAPPLDGSGHGWHHPLAILYSIISNGSPGGQGNMPAWRGKLSEDQIVAVIAWFQSHWSDDIYRNWVARDALSRK